MAKQIVTAGLKCPPEVGAATMMANMIPSAKATPIWKKLLNAAAPTGLSALTMKLATEATPENLLKKKSLRQETFLWILVSTLGRETYT